MSKSLFWINTDASTGNVRNTTKEQRSLVQSQIQRGRPRKRKPKGHTSSNVPVTGFQDIVRPQELYDAAVRSLSADFDPFDSACVPLDITAKGLMRYYVHRYHPSQWPGLPFATKNGAYSFKSSVDRIISTSIEDSLMMCCLLTAASSRLQHTDRLSFPNVAKREDQYTHQALQLMRGHLGKDDFIAESELNMLLQCMTFLTSAESYRANYLAAGIHLKACLDLLEPHGGIMQLQDRHIQGQILMGDLFLACVNFQPCLCGCEYDPGPATVLNLQPFEVPGSTHTFQGFELMRAVGSIAGELMQALVEQIVETYDIRTHLEITYMAPRRVLEIGQWVTLRNMAIRNQLLAIVTHDHRVQALKAAIVMWTLLAMNYTGRVTTVKVMANGLRDTLQNTPDREWRSHQELKLWILLVGHSCSAGASGAAEWFRYEVQQIAPLCMDIQQQVVDKEGVVNWLESFQTGFLYHAPIQRPSSEEIGESLSRI